MKKSIIRSRFQNDSQPYNDAMTQCRNRSRGGGLILAVTVLIGLFLCPSFGVCATELTTIDSGICTDVIDHKAVGTGEVFSRDVGRLYCFTRVLGPYLEEKGQHVVHVWYYKEKERARITLPVRSSNWGTYSSKIIQPFETGNWHVDVLDPEGEVVHVFQFFIKE